MFDAIVMEKAGEAVRKQLDEASLPADGDVTVRVVASTLNSKDGLAITGKSPIIRTFPMTPGVDLAGVVEESASPAFKKGDRVLLNGWGVGETHPGGLAQKAKVKSEWLQPIPEKLSARQTMALGTAGYTAMLCVMALEAHGVTPDKGEILVTGAGGGVGGVALQLLAKLGYTAVASTGRPAEAEYLKTMGAASVIDRNELSGPGKPLGKERWAGVIDSVGSHTLANACAQTKYGGTVAACGLAQGMDFPATVAPFILRGVTLAGIDSVRRPMPDRKVAWSRLAELIDPATLDAMTRTITLADTIAAAGDLLAGKIRGRVVVAIGEES
jgi:acrylyl-CoA reductase (NADPH)